MIRSFTCFQANNMNKKSGFFFIIGRPRSGTTLIRTLFDAHPNVQIPIESPFLVGMHKRFKKISRWNEKNLTEFYEALFGFPHFNEWTLGRDKLKSDLLKMQGDYSFQDIIRIVYSHYISFYPKEDIHITGDKNPDYTLHVRKLMKLFPDAKFIFIVRDYRDHFQSMMKRDFEATIPTLIGWRWKYYVRDIDRIIKKNPEKCMLIRYEDFVNAPNEHMKSMCAFLKIPYTDSVFDFYKSHSTARLLHSEEVKKNHMSLIKPVNKSRIGLWKKDLSAQQIKSLECSVGKWGGKYGYANSGRIGIITCLKILPIIIYGKLMYSMIRTGDNLPWKCQMRLLKSLQFFLNFYNKHLKK